MYELIFGDPAVQQAIAPLAIAAIAGGAALTKGAINFFSGKKKEERATKRIEDILGGMSSYQQDRYTAKEYETPEQVAKMEQLAESRLGAQTGLPGEDIYAERIGASQAATSRAIQQTAEDPSQALGALTDVYGRTQQSIQDLGLRSAEYKSAQEQQRIAEYNQALQMGAQYSNIGQQFEAQQAQAAYQSNVGAQQQEYQMNVLNPAQVRLGVQSAQLSAGLQQKSSGFQGLINAPIQGMQAYLGAGGTFGSPAVPTAAAAPATQALPGMGGSQGFKGV